MARIKEVHVENYKGFKKVSIGIKPITIFLGANSVGKSSMMKLLLLITQNINSKNYLKSGLKINGDVVEFGSFKNIVHKHDLSNVLKIGFSSENISQVDVLNEIYNKIFILWKALKRINFLVNEGVDKYLKSSDDISNEINAIEDDFYKNKDSEMIFNILEEVETMKKNISKASKNDKENITQYYSIFLSKDDYKDDVLIFNTKELVLICLFYTKLKKYDEIVCSYSFQELKNEVIISKFEINSKDQSIFLYEQNGKKYTISSDLIEKEKMGHYGAEFGAAISFNQFQIHSNDTVSIFVKEMINLCQKYTALISEQFNYNNINYVDPLRAYPRRYYFLDDADNDMSINKIDGEKMAIMLKENTLLKRKVNKWIEKFNLKVDVTQLQEVIHNIKITQNGLSLDITDVGFGISQVLPIITQGFFSVENSTTLIEQPEIHLHPKMQAELGDLFIDIVNDKNIRNRKLIIETHSEYLLKRLRRRIAEGKISSDDVAIYSFELDNKLNEATISQLNISKKGAFDWPKDFYSTDMDDTIEFLKLQD